MGAHSDVAMVLRSASLTQLFVNLHTKAFTSIGWSMIMFLSMIHIQVLLHPRVRVLSVIPKMHVYKSMSLFMSRMTPRDLIIFAYSLYGPYAWYCVKDRPSFFLVYLIPFTTSGRAVALRLPNLYIYSPYTGSI